MNQFVATGGYPGEVTAIPYAIRYAIPGAPQNIDACAFATPPSSVFIPVTHGRTRRVGHGEALTCGNAPRTVPSLSRLAGMRAE